MVRDDGVQNEIGNFGLRGNRTIFVLLFAIPILATVAYGSTDTWALIFLAPLIGILGIVWIIRSWRNKAIEINLDAIQLPMLGLLLLGLVQLLPFGGATVPADAISIAASEALSMDPYATRLFLVRLAGYIIFFAATLTFVSSPDRLRKTVVALMIFGGVLAFVGIIQKLASPDAIYGIRKPAQAIPFGPYVNQHHFASLMVLLSGLALGHLFGGGVSRQAKLLIGISAVMMGIAVPLTSSRGGLLSYVVMAGVASLAFFTRRSRDDRSRGRMPVFVGVVSAVIVGVGLIILLGGADLLLRGIGFHNPTDDISSGRLHFWTVAWQIFKAHPILGAGLDSFGVAYTRFDTNSGLFRVEQAHNEYLQMLAEGGILGLLLLVGFIVLLVRKCLNGIVNAADEFHRVTIIGAWAGCIGIFVHSFFDFPLRTAGNAFFFLLIVAIAVVRVPGSTTTAHER